MALQELDLCTSDGRRHCTLRGCNVPDPARPCVQGNCTAPPPASVRLSHRLRRGQCLIVVQRSVLRPAAAQGHKLWLDGLYILASGVATDSPALLEWSHVPGGGRDSASPEPSQLGNETNRLWVTRTVLEGDRVRSAAAAVQHAAYFAGAHYAAGQHSLVLRTISRPCSVNIECLQT